MFAKHVAIGCLIAVLAVNRCQAQRTYNREAARNVQQLQEAQAAYDAGDLEKSFRLYKQATEQANVFAFGPLGINYRFGTGTEANYAEAEAVKWYEKCVDAAGGRAPDAAHNLGRLYAAGAKDLLADLKLARKWFAKASELGESLASADLEQLDQGRNPYVARHLRLQANLLEKDGDNDGAVNLYRQAAEQGNRLAQYKIGRGLYSGARD